MIPPAIRRKYNNFQPLIRTVAERVKEAVLGFCESNGYAYAGRIKSDISIAEKLESGRFASWSEIDDIFACTIVIPTLEHESRVLEFLRNTFSEKLTKRRGSTKKAPDVFRFDATRFIGRLEVPEGLAGESDLRSICFEVQIRSAFEHAWSVTTHSLTYKSGRIDWRLQRLTAQLKAAVEQMDSVVLAFETSAEQIVEHDWPELNAKQQLLEGFSELFETGQLPEEMEPKDRSRFAENVYALLASSKGFQRGEAQRIVAGALQCVGAYLTKYGPLAVPRSISLFQFVLAILTEEGVLNFPLRNFNVLVTPELIQFHPNTKDVEPVVNLNL